MHRVSWASATDSATCLASDGMLVLPARVAEAVSAYGLALLPQHALLLGPRGARLLTPGAPLCAGGASIVWEPGAAPVASTGERTAPSDGVPAHPPPSALSTWDGRGLVIAARPVLVGRHAACDLRLDDAHVSQFHCALVRMGDAVRLVDLGSTNGSFVDGVRVQHAAIARRAALRLGDTRLVLAPAEAPTELDELPSAAMRRLVGLVGRVAAARVPVLIQGESGVGKDLVARHLHALSGRGGPLVALNAATLTPTLAASELFGHVRGAFTGADRDHDGAFLRAHEGTLFLDEVAELSLPVQAELLRAVELGRVRRVGEGHEVPVDVRLVAATHRDLAARVRGGEFREDLYHRLCVVPLTVPPLRERPEDIEAIAERFVRSQDVPLTLSDAARAKLRAHPWSGNVRELLNALRRACTFARGRALDAADLELSPPLAAAADDLEAVIQERVLETYARCQSVAVTARRLGLRRGFVQKVLRRSRRDDGDPLEVHEPRG